MGCPPSYGLCCSQLGKALLWSKNQQFSLRGLSAILGSGSLGICLWDFWMHWSSFIGWQQRLVGTLWILKPRAQTLIRWLDLIWFDLIRWLNYPNIWRWAWNNTMVLFDPKKRDRHLYTYFLHLGGAWHISGNLNESCLNMLKSNWHKSVRKKTYIFVFHLSCHSTKSMVKLKILICGQLGPRRKGWPLPVSLSDLFVVASTQTASTAGQTTDFNCQPHRFLSRDGDDDDLDWRTHPSSGLVTQFQVTWEPITHELSQMSGQ